MTDTRHRTIELWLVDLASIEASAIDAAWSCIFAAIGNGVLPVPGRGSAVEPADAIRRAAHQVLRLLLARDVGPRVAAEPFRTDPLGKPALAAPGPQFSLSHSGQAALIALSRHGAVGTDIESPRTVRMPPERRAAILAAGSAAVPHAPIADARGSDLGLLQAWVRLEALAKARGCGMARLLTELGVVARSSAAATASEGIDAVLAGFSIRDVVMPADYLGAVASRTRAADTIDAADVPVERLTTSHLEAIRGLAGRAA